MVSALQVIILNIKLDDSEGVPLQDMPLWHIDSKTANIRKKILTFLLYMKSRK